jgi:hypothetical protein
MLFFPLIVILLVSYFTIIPNAISQKETLNIPNIGLNHSINTIINNTNSSESIVPFANPEDLPNVSSDSFIVGIAKTLTKLNSTQVRDYNIADSSPNQIKLVFDLLNPITLGKVLLNIDKDDLLSIRDKLSPTLFNQTLSKLVSDDKIKVEDRLSIALDSINNK